MVRDARFNGPKNEAQGQGPSEYAGLYVGCIQCSVRATSKCCGRDLCNKHGDEHRRTTHRFKSK